MHKTWHLLIKELLDVGMTQKSIAESIGVTQSAISHVLSGEGQRGFRYEPGKKLLSLHRRQTRVRAEAANV